jgi:hypothetical protein
MWVPGVLAPPLSRGHTGSLMPAARSLIAAGPRLAPFPAGAVPGWHCRWAGIVARRTRTTCGKPIGFMSRLSGPALAQLASGAHSCHCELTAPRPWG